jgi:hypothetical protein
MHVIVIYTFTSFADFPARWAALLPAMKRIILPRATVHHPATRTAMDLCSTAMIYLNDGMQEASVKHVMWRNWSETKIKKSSTICLKRTLGITETCFWRKTFKVPRTWSSEDANFKHPDKMEPSYNGNKFKSIALPLQVSFSVLTAHPYAKTSHHKGV